MRGLLIAKLGSNLVAHLAQPLELLDAGHERKHVAQRSHRGRPVERPELAFEDVRPVKRKAGRSNSQRRVGPDGDLHGERELVPADVEGSKGHGQSFGRAKGGDRVLILLLLARQVGALQVEEFGSEQTDGFRARRHRRRHTRQRLDIGCEVDVDTIGGDRWQATSGRQLPFAIPLNSGPGAIDA